MATCSYEDTSGKCSKRKVRPVLSLGYRIGHDTPNAGACLLCPDHLTAAIERAENEPMVKIIAIGPEGFYKAQCQIIEINSTIRRGGESGFIAIVETLDDDRVAFSAISKTRLSLELWKRFHNEAGAIKVEETPIGGIWYSLIGVHHEI